MVFPNQTLKALYLILLIGLYPFFNSFAQNHYELDSKVIIEYLASDSLMGRPSGSVYEVKARNFIESQLSQMGIASETQCFKFKDDDGNRVESSNLLAPINLGKKKTIIIGAHYDHLSINSPKSKDLTNKGIHNGADDNASGVALALQLVQAIIEIPENFQYNFLVVFFGAHEVGLHGSQEFVKAKMPNSLDLELLINFDMVGRLNESSRTVAFNFFNLSENWQNKLDAVNNNSTLNIRIDSDPNKYSDDKAFRMKGAPTLSITTGIHEDYHRSTDDVEKINFDGIALIAQAILELIGVQSIKD